MSKNDHGDGHRCTFGLQKCTALEYQKRVGIPYYTPENIRSCAII